MYLLENYIKRNIIGFEGGLWPGGVGNRRDLVQGWRGSKEKRLGEMIGMGGIFQEWGRNLMQWKHQIYENNPIKDS